MAALTKFFWNTAKNLATAATGVLAPAAEPTPASLEGEAGLGSELEQPQSETDEEEKGEEEKEDGGAEYGSLLFRAEVPSRSQNSLSREAPSGDQRVLINPRLRQFLDRARGKVGDDIYFQLGYILTAFSSEPEAMGMPVSRLVEHVRGLLRDSPELALGFDASLLADGKTELAEDIQECDNDDGDGDDDDDDDDDDEYTSADGSMQESSYGSPCFHRAACEACAADDAAVERGALEECQKCRPVWITAEEYEKDALVAMERASEKLQVASVAVGEGDQQHQQQQLCLCDYHREIAYLGITQVPEKEEEEEEDEEEEVGDGGRGWNAYQTAANPDAEAKASPQPAPIGADGGEEEGEEGDKGDGDDDEGSEQKGSIPGSLAGSPTPDVMASRRHATSALSSFGDEEKGGITDDCPQEPTETPENKAAEAVEAARAAREPVPEKCRSFPRGDEAAAHPDISGGARGDRMAARRAVEAEPHQLKEKQHHHHNQQPSDGDGDGDHEPEAARRRLDDTTTTAPQAGQHGSREEDLPSSLASPAPGKEFEGLVQDPSLVPLPPSPLDPPQEPHAKKREEAPSDQPPGHKVAVATATASSGPRLPGGHDDGTRLKKDPANTHRRRTGPPEQHRVLGSAPAPSPSPSERPPLQQGEEGGSPPPPPRARKPPGEKNQRRRQRPAGDAHGEEGNQSRPPPPEPSPSTAAAAAVKQAAAPAEEAAAAAAMRPRQDQDAAGSTAGGGARADGRPEEATGAGEAGVQGRLDLETRERGAGEEMTAHQNGKKMTEAPEKEMTGSAEEGREGEEEEEGEEEKEEHKKRETGAGKSNQKPALLSRAERRAADRERAKEKTRAVKARRLEQHKKNNNPKRLQGQLLAEAPATAAAAPPPPPPTLPPAQAQPPPETKMKQPRKTWKKIPRGSVVSNQDPGGGGGGGVGGKRVAKDDDNAEEERAAGAAINRQAATTAAAPAATAGGFPETGDAACKPAAGSKVAAAARPPAAAAVPAPSSGATKPFASNAPRPGPLDRLPTQAAGTGKKHPGTGKVSAAAKKADADNVRGLSRPAKGLVETNPAASASPSPSAKTTRTPRPTAVGDHPSATPPSGVATLPHPSSNPMGAFPLREGEGWTWPAVDAPGGGVNDGARDPKGREQRGRGQAAVVPKPGPLGRFAWIGRAAAVGGRVKHPWGSWKRWRKPEKWEKMVAAALTRYPKPGPGPVHHPLTPAEKKALVAVVKSKNNVNLANVYLQGRFRRGLEAQDTTAKQDLKAFIRDDLKESVEDFVERWEASPDGGARGGGVGEWAV